jgi:aminoglycoside phosphotransferase (APT) family kinase protein
MTVNGIYRLGDHLCARLPRVQRWAQDLDKERHWLPKLAPRLSLPVPEPVGKGHPGSSYPFSWAILRELDSDAASAAWERALHAPAWNGTPVWIHGDLLRPNLLVRDGRRGVLDVDDGTWNRARGFALHQAALIIAYYGETNPGLVAPAKRTVEEILADSNP